MLLDACKPGSAAQWAAIERCFCPLTDGLRFVCRSRSGSSCGGNIDGQHVFAATQAAADVALSTGCRVLHAGSAAFVPARGLSGPDEANGAARLADGAAAWLVAASVSGGGRAVVVSRRELVAIARGAGRAVLTEASRARLDELGPGCAVFMPEGSGENGGQACIGRGLESVVAWQGSAGGLLVFVSKGLRQLLDDRTELFPLN